MDPMTARDLSDAIVQWTGWGDAAWPIRDDERVIARFGVEAALDLVPAVHRLEGEFYESDARLVINDLTEMGAAAAARFRDLHPEIGDDAVAAFAWCYTYDFK